ncbi:hypothetical protein [Bradyrhizobium sp. WD16]|uniref:hypothetical protein n=1 Tax=Bradyrhizobium sp. WD16 TaxID=1521768 RepID=UPI0020A40F5F|nr:hypothetical protein [Bradyrhizobium sp. WD16]
MAQPDILTRITTRLPLVLFTMNREETDGAYFEAAKRANDPVQYGAPERREVLGRQRHWLLESGLRRAGEAGGLTIAAKDTNPVGGRYTLLISDHFVIGRAKPDRYRGNIRPVRYRKQLAAMNAAVSQFQGDLFGLSAPVVAGPRLYGLFLSAAHPKDLDTPAFLNFAIPDSSLSRWIFNEPVETVIAAYNAVERPAEIIPDLAVVALKQKPNDVS